MIKVSVILPVYGVAEYIEKCTESLLAQTLQEMEFIFVDDHGPDNSIELVQRMIENHPRKDQFVFLKPEHNMGAGMARNFAIPQARGEYLSFIDSDDWVEPTMFEELYNEALRHDGTDLCCCQISKDYLDGQPSEILSNPDVEPGILTDDKRRYFLSHYVSLFSTFIYRREMINRHEIRFPSSRSADDSYFITCSLLMASSIAHVDKPFYHYIIRPGSVCTTNDSTKYQKRLETFSSLMAFLKEKGVYDKFHNEIDFIYIKKGYFASVFNYISNSLKPKKTTIHEIRSEMMRQVPAYKSNAYFNSKQSLRALDWMLAHTTGLAIKIIAVYVKKNNMMV